jgi:hypothetical protein
MKKFIALCITPLLFWGGVMAQIPVEVFGGHEKTTFDVMFFEFIKNVKESEASAKPTRFLFFNRNRASFDYRQTSTKYLPLFGFTEAISYNHPKLKGFAPVLVAQVNNKGIVPKVGMQYFHRKGDVTLFSWVVSETEKEPAFDFFMLTRYEPVITKQLHLFTQLELINAFPTKSSEPLNFYQRVRLGIKINAFQFGAGVDFNEFGKTTFTNTNNIGGFLRYEFY